MHGSFCIANVQLLLLLFSSGLISVRAKIVGRASTFEAEVVSGRTWCTRSRGLLLRVADLSLCTDVSINSS